MFSRLTSFFFLGCRNAPVEDEVPFVALDLCFAVVDVVLDKAA